jgi:ABC-type nitrate/sulfonate/bicarbonate transport system substrate-binding protein
LDQGPLSENGLDAVVCFPPFSTALMRHGNLKILYDSARLAQPLFDVLVVERGMLKERPEVLRQLLVAFHKAKILREQRPDWADSLMAKWEGVSLAEFRQTFNGIKLHDLASQPAMLEKEVPASLDYVRDLLVEQGLLNGALPSPGDAVDSRPAREAARGN